MISTDKTIYINREKYYGVRELGFIGDNGTFIVNMFTTPPPEPRSRYFTAIPISVNTLRKRLIDQSIKLHKRTITIYDDWGSITEITGPQSIIDELYQDCLAHIISLLI